MAGLGKRRGYLQTCLRKSLRAPRPDPVDDGIHSSNFLLQREMEKAHLSPLAAISRSAACGPSDHTPISSSRHAQGIHKVCPVSCLKCVLLSGSRWEIIAPKLCSHVVMKTLVTFNENHRPGHESCGLSDVCAQLCRNTEVLGVKAPSFSHDCWTPRFLGVSRMLHQI